MKSKQTNKKHFTDVLKNEGNGELLLWRHPLEDFNTHSTLVVMPGEQAVFLDGGKIVQIFENGTYDLTTENYPLISRLRNVFTGGVSAFHCVVYFVKRSISTEVAWGTAAPIQVRDKVLGIATTLKANGAYKVQVSDVGKWLEKLVGNNVAAMAPAELNDYFFAEFQGHILSVIAQQINDSEEEILGIAARSVQIAALIKPRLQTIFDEYGVTCVSFSIAAITIADDELRKKYDTVTISAMEKRKMGAAEADVVVTMAEAEKAKAIKEAEAKAQGTILQGEAESRVMSEMGKDKWTAARSAQIAETMAANTGAGGIAAAGAGLGLGLAAAAPFGQLAQQFAAPTGNREEGAAQWANENAPAAPSPRAALQELKSLFDDGLITEAEYTAQKAELLKKVYGGVR